MILKKNFFVSLFIVCVAYFSIFNSNLFYVDDGLRVFSHTSINQGIHGRPLADSIYSFFSGGLFVDVSPLSQIYSLCFILLSGYIITFIFIPSQNKTPTTYLLIISFSLLPINSSLLCYRYDSLSMSFAMLCATLAFFLQHKKFSVIRLLSSIFCLWCVLASYQPMINIYFCCCCFLFVKYILQEKVIHSIKTISYQIATTICAGILYTPIFFHAEKKISLPFCGLPRHPYITHYNKVFDFDSILFKTIHQIQNYYTTIKNFLGTDIISLCIYMIIILTISSVITKKIQLKYRIIALCGIICAFFSCGLLFILLHFDVFAPRTLLALSVFILCCQCIAYNSRYIYIQKPLIVVTLLCIVASANVLSALGNALRDQASFEDKIIIQPLAIDLATLSQSRGTISLAVRGNPPLHNSLAVLLRQYSYFSPATTGGFLIIRFISWLPIKHDLALTHSGTDISHFPLVITRLAYDIRKINDDKYIVIFKSNYLPKKIEKFQN